jgi:NAD(P)H-flavin reductase
VHGRHFTQWLVGKAAAAMDKVRQTVRGNGGCRAVWQVYQEGRMSQHLDKMVLGDCILAKGPKGRFTYMRNMKRHIGTLP